ncbi:MAG: hypothetical protein OXJ53_06705 [Gammaproteobacteria bacterium]|nr:hypothetical protein [Gammaproteobacteria bacterium]MDE0270949.1 hypothetical protein [Gammaproteobacteria bacterium]
MDVFTMVAVIVSVSCAAGVANQYFRTRAKTAGKLDSAAQREVDDLRKRVEVLEEIVTDHKYDLAKEINRLDGREDREGVAKP